MKTIKSTWVWWGCWLALAHSVGAQPPSPGQFADQYAQSAKQNATVLRNYTWNMRVQLTVKGEAKPAALYLMRYDMQGQLQKTLVSPPQQPKKERGLRGKVAAKKEAEAKQFIESVTELVKSYTAPTPGAMYDFYSKAQFAPQPDGTVKASGTGFLNKGDSVTFIVDPTTKQAQSYTFTAPLGSDTVQGTVQFSQVPNGPRYAAQTTVAVPSKQLQGQVETSQYTAQ